MIRLLPVFSALLMGCHMASVPDTDPGVSRNLARYRQGTVTGPRYQLRFSLPEERSHPVRGEVTLSFEWSGGDHPLILDFDRPRSRVAAISVNGEEAVAEYTEDHILLPPGLFRRGKNSVSLAFEAGDDALNRNDEFMYTLFVPDRASTAFPCFDQPDLKARFRLTLEIPSSWTAIANGELRTEINWKKRTILGFEETAAIPTYLFSFVAGKFRVVTAERAGRRMRFLHRETDQFRLDRNRDRLFDLHATALAWLEAYTGIPYPFAKFDFALVPSFQYNGMEHPGAILYRADSLLLEDSPTQDQELRRAGLIAHETAHMWFGNLVTMEWFDDVWMKEVFANFMAAKIVHPFFPKLNHDLRFLMAHYPVAYDVDRTAGANPIRQDLPNMKEAGSLYGAIIYKKAPIVMRMLEELTGEAAFRKGVRDYLSEYSFRNASWPDLVGILDRKTSIDLREWSRTWVEKAGRPEIRVDLVQDNEGKIVTLLLRQDPVRKQPLSLLLGKKTLPVTLDDPELAVREAKGLPVPDFFLPNGRGRGYGRFVLDPSSRSHLLQHLPKLEDPLLRGISWLTLWDDMLEGEIPPGALFDLAIRALKFEEEELNVSRFLHDLNTLYWRFLSVEDRTRFAPNLESFLLDRIAKSEKASLKSAFFRTFRSVVLSSEGVTKLRRIWNGTKSIPGIGFSESDRATLALEIAMRLPGEAETVLMTQRERMRNPDRKRRFEFVSPAISPDVATREAFFKSLKNPANREHEPWVLEAVHYLHHPLRAADSIRWIRPSLDLLLETRETGDIFFPKRWLDATLWGHRSEAPAEVVRTFLEEHPDYPEKLRGKILQTADELFRAADILQH